MIWDFVLRDAALVKSANLKLLAKAKRKRREVVILSAVIKSNVIFVALFIHPKFNKKVLYVLKAAKNKVQEGKRLGPMKEAQHTVKPTGAKIIVNIK